MKRIALVLIAAFCQHYQAHAQDPTFTQPYNNPIYLNPALTGTQADKGLRLFMNDMRQWTQVPGDINTFSFSGDFSESCYPFGFGINALHDERGEGTYQTNQFGITICPTIKLSGSRSDRSARSELAVGLGADFAQKSLDWSKLKFSDQYDPVLGLISSSNAQPHDVSTPYTDFNAGASYIFTTNYFNNGQRFLMVNNIGVAVHHVFRPAIGFNSPNSETGRLPRLLTIHAGSNIQLGEYSSDKNTFLFPYAVWDIQEPETVFKEQTEFIAGINLDKNFWEAGMHYRTGNFLVSYKYSSQFGLSGGYKFVVKHSGTSAKISYSYIFPLDGVSYSVGGTHEISLFFMFSGARVFCNDPSDHKGGRMSCPNF